MTDWDHKWPSPDDNADEAKARYQAELDLRLKRVDAEIARDAAATAAQSAQQVAAIAAAATEAATAADTKQLDDDFAHGAAERAAELASKAAYEQALLDVAKGTLDRARANADLVQKASAALVPLYTGALALVFSVTDHPLPLRGLIPTIFLGLAVVASTIYLAYVTDPRSVEGPRPTSVLREMARRRVAAFIIWTRSAAFARAYWLRVSVLALAASLAFLPAPFLGSNANAKATAIQPATPWPPDVPTENNELTRILFQAQVNEIADLRKGEVARAQRASTTTSESDKWWWIGFVLALAVIFGVPFIKEPRATEPTVADAEQAI